MKFLIGDTLRILRKKRDLSQQEVADFLCISRPTYVRYEHNIVEPNLTQFANLAQLYNIGLKEIIDLISVDNQQMHN
ncbi:XRE family transcriptional regulator [Pedobacter frigidisoli]|uniref:XRE family transcriptional regulator n=1 Tax=Pedobacter frigidisoli TaxID=2530455 RepID=A0A4R0P7I8_9SPHI|nr:MAG: XRE family transcriptional regulator [Chryseobacterium sp.]TCD13000.1 XRE family transcriptional regulator [Pedobacter frigidisoli]